MSQLVRERARHRRSEHRQHADARHDRRAGNPPQPLQIPERLADPQMNFGDARIVRVERNPCDRRVAVDDGRGRCVNGDAEEAIAALRCAIDDAPRERHAGVTPDRVGLGQHVVDERTRDVWRRVHGDLNGWERRRDGQREYGEHGGQLTGTTRPAARG